MYASIHPAGPSAIPTKSNRNRTSNSLYPLSKTVTTQPSQHDVSPRRFLICLVEVNDTAISSSDDCSA